MNTKLVTLTLMWLKIFNILLRKLIKKNRFANLQIKFGKNFALIEFINGLEMKKLIITVGVFLFTSFSYGQFGSWGDWGDSGDEKKKEEKKEKAESDTSSSSEWESSDDEGWGSDDGWGGGGSSNAYQKPIAKKKQFKKEEKIELPFDSVRKLIIYKGIQELEECEFCTEDSLYYRFKNWAKEEWGKKLFKNKNVVGLDEQFQKINLKLNVPLNIEENKFKSYQKGTVQVNLTMWFQPYRYKYLFSNFVHEVPPTGTQTEAQMVYFEYYRKSKRNTEENNNYLKAIDKQVKAYISQMRVALDDKPISLMDEDDW